MACGRRRQVCVCRWSGSASASAGADCSLAAGSVPQRGRRPPGDDMEEHYEEVDYDVAEHGQPHSAEPPAGRGPRVVEKLTGRGVVRTRIVAMCFFRARPRAAGSLTGRRAGRPGDGDRGDSRRTAAAAACRPTEAGCGVEVALHQPATGATSAPAAATVGRAACPFARRSCSWFLHAEPERLRAEGSSSGLCAGAARAITAARSTTVRRTR